jgi:anti-sigma-K factor RskA
MRHSQLTDDLQEQASLYAAGAMPESERREYARHLEEDQCAVCRAEVDELQAAMGIFAFSVPPATPSASVRIRLIEQAQNAIPRRPAQSFMRRHWFDLIAGAVAAASLIAVLLTARANDELQRFASGLLDRVNELEIQISQQRTQLASMTSRDVRIIRLAGKDATPDANGRIYWDTAQQKWLYYMYDLPPAKPGEVYQLWFVPKGRNPVSAGIVDPAGDGSAQGEVDLAAIGNDLTNLGLAAVTIEPAPGREQPGGPFALVSLTE